MALLNRKVDYALLILSHLHHHPEGGCARILAEQYGLSRAFVANILKSLCRHGYVVSHRGIKGGYALQAAMMHRSLAELMDDLDGSVRLSECNGESPAECWQVFGAVRVMGPVAGVSRRLDG